jgi:hypothetical protein
MCPETHSFRDTCYYLRSIICHDEKRVVRCTRTHTQYSAKLSYGRAIVSRHTWRILRRTVDPRCLELSSWYCLLCALHFPVRRHPNANVFQRLERRFLETGVKLTALCDCMLPTDSMDTSHWRCWTTAVEKLTRYRTRVWAVPAERLEVLKDDTWHSYHSRGAVLPSDDDPLTSAILRLATTSTLWFGP